MSKWRMLLGNAWRRLKDIETDSVQCCVTSPPYFDQRDYGVEGQLGFNQTFDVYVDCLALVFDEVRRTLRDDGILWLNLGDGYTSGGRKTRAKDEKTPHRESSVRAPTPDGMKPKDLMGVPWAVAVALRQRGWYLRQDVIWHKPNPMPSSVSDRCVSSHEHVFLLSKKPRYHFDHKAIREPAVTGKWDAMPPIGGKKHTAKGDNVTYTGNRPAGDGLRNKRDVWTVATSRSKQSHCAVFPAKLIEPMILAGCPVGGLVLDPFAGTGTTGVVSVGLGRRFVGVELNPEYHKLACTNLRKAVKGACKRS